MFGKREGEDAPRKPKHGKTEQQKTAEAEAIVFLLESSNESERGASKQGPK